VNDPATPAALTEAESRGLHMAVNRLREMDPLHSAAVAFVRWQRVALWTVLILAALCAVWRPMQTAVVLIALSTFAYLYTMLDRVLIFRQGLAHRPLTVSDEEARSIPDSRLPTYTILVPAYGEPEVIGELLDAMEQLEYPVDKLQILLLLEADDEATIMAAAACKDAESITIVLVPPAEPRTKPKACNYGLLFATGDIVTIYDAEDLPEPLQLRRTVAAFHKSPPDVVCVQSKLRFHNSSQNLLTAWFTAEYNLWFGYLLPGMMQTGSPIPLGGTSNHLRREVLEELGGWDPFNVTEDADLGIRICAYGYRTMVLESTTLEEANSDPINWIRQRSRWYKGYLQTWLVHIRDPVALWRAIGGRAFIRSALVLGGTPIIAVLNIAFWLLTALWVLGQPPAVESLFPWYVFFPALVALVLGNGATLYMNLIAIREDDRGDLLGSAFSVPLFFLMMSVAAAKGVYQLVRNPSYWEKTAHGLTAPPDARPAGDVQ
jgi:cellulose synthase/poly-beta-1,6-N-acetylglucosamine synthase-like glycosyltransferase